jgi:glycosyltransferase involved in cell wall biosynthesis
LSFEKKRSDIENRVGLSIVIPLYNEKESLRELHNQVCRVVEKTDISFEIIYVDDGSTDGSFRLLEEIHQKDSRVKVIQFRKNSGKADALSAGFAAVSGELVVTMDADLQDDPAGIPDMLAKLDDGYDLISGWKKKRRDPLSKRIPSRIFNRVTRLITGVRIHDFNCGLKVYRREVVESLNVYGELHRYIPALAKWEGFRIGEIQVNHRARKYGRTKYGGSRFIKGFLDLITVMFLSRYTRRPLHLFGFIGLLSSIAGFAITMYLVILRITKAAYLSNRPLLFIGVLLLIIGIQFISIGLLGEMITRSQASGHTYKIRRSLGV